ncbi:MAG: type I methionyl aminopeptidase [Candidatus Omnitrophica bacterium]|nr:type I methionyl aminopeptidase [Candidatus Omnitrophota bacterium]
MIRLKSKREIEIMERAAKILRQAFEKLRPSMRPGISTLDLDAVAEKAIKEAGGESAFKGYRGFPRTLCVSINEEVVHGIPSPKRKLKDGDIVSLDLGVKYQGYYADAARSWAVGEISAEAQKLIRVAKEAFLAGFDAVRKSGKRIGDLSQAVQEVIESNGFQVVRDYVGHGIGQTIHEEPQVPNFGKAGQGPKIEPGLVIAIEPMVTAGHYSVETLEDGWTVVTKDRRLASHYEDTIAFTDSGPLNLTGPEEN